MKLEKLERNKKKKIVIGVVVFLCFISAIIYTGSRAKYKVTQSIPLVNGTINYTPADLKVVAIYKKDDGDTNYQSVNEIPAGNYKLNETESYCTTDGTNKDNNIIITYENGNLGVNKINKKGTKCFFYFDQRVGLTSAQRVQLMGLTATAGATSFTGVTTSNEGLKSGTDNDGTTYYFRGNVTNNWVQFAGFYWRIIRINGDGSIRLIYNGTTTGQTGTGTQIGTKKFNDVTTQYAEHSGLQYTLNEQHGNTVNSTILGETNSTDITTLFGWYNINIKNLDIEKFVEVNGNFCSARDVANGHSNYPGTTGTGKIKTVFTTANKILTTNFLEYRDIQEPSFKCNVNDLLKIPIGLINAYEIIFAGGFGGNTSSSTNKDYYLYTGKQYWTMSPSNLGRYQGGVDVFFVETNGSLSYGGTISNSFGVRPVINLSSGVKLTGTGTTSDPYKVV